MSGHGPALLSNSRKDLVGTALVIGACLVSSLTKLIARGRMTPAQLVSPTRFVLATEWDVVLIALVLAIVIFWEQCGLDSIGFRAMSRKDVAGALVVLIVGLTLHRMSAPVVARWGLSGIAIRIEDAPPLLEWSSIILAPIAEEMVFRGYLIERLEKLIGSTSVSVTASSALFALWHYPLWGMQNVLISGMWGILLAMLYIWRRNLPACILMHFVTDAVLAGDVGFSIARARGTRYLSVAMFLRIFR